MSKPHKRIATVSLRNVDKNDLKAVLQAVREALREKNVQLRILDKPEDAPAPPDERKIAFEHLEAAALNAAAKVLEEKAKQHTATESHDPAGKAEPPPVAVAKARKSIRTWIADKAKAFWSVTVKAGLEFAKEQVKGGGGTS